MEEKSYFLNNSNVWRSENCNNIPRQSLPTAARTDSCSQLHVMEYIRRSGFFIRDWKRLAP